MELCSWIPDGEEVNQWDEVVGNVENILRTHDTNDTVRFSFPF